MSDEKTTKMGTPCSPRWDEYWVLFVEDTESRLGRRVCGAETPHGFPCEAAAENESGRCAMHGGAAHIGGQARNTNALRDGLYARRLRPCNNRCPHWATCPMANPDVEQMPLHARPACVYEMHEYEMTYSALLLMAGMDPERLDRDAPKAVRFAQAMFVEAVETYALNKVLALRAAGVLKKKPLDDVVQTSAAMRHGLTTKTSGAVEACLKFTREQRHWHKRVMVCGKEVVELMEEWELEKGVEKNKGKKRGIDHEYDYDYEEDKVEENDKDKDKDKDREALGVVARKEGKSRGSKTWIGKAKKEKTRKGAMSREAFLVGMNASGEGAARAGNVIDVHAAVMDMKKRE